MRIKLDRNPMPAGELTRITTEVTNIGSKPLNWLHDGCATLVYVWGEMLDVTWRPGVEQIGTPRRFKDRVLDLIYDEDPPVHPFVWFVPEERTNDGAQGCADVGITETIKPGERRRGERVWSGSSTFRWGPPPSGPVTLTGVFQYHWRSGEPHEGPGKETSVQLDAWVTGGADETWLSPPEVVDAALADAEFVAYLESQDLGRGRQEILWYRPELGAWEVGLLIWYDHPEPRMHLLIVDPHSGVILDRVDRPWDEERDGFP